jgi:hypothetical protein
LKSPIDKFVIFRFNVFYKRVTRSLINLFLLFDAFMIKKLNILL